VPAATAVLVRLATAVALGVGFVVASSAPAAHAASTWVLSNSPDGTGAKITLGFAEPGDVPIAGDWNGDGTDTPGLFRERAAGVPPLWILSNSTTGEGPVVSFSWGAAGDRPLAGDWNGDGVDTVGVYRPSSPNVFYLATSDTDGGGSPVAVSYGNGGEQPLTGDWDNGGYDKVAVVRGPNTPEFYLAPNNVPGASAFASFTYGNPGDIPLAGDWNGDGADTVGIFRRAGTTNGWALASRNINGGGALTSFALGDPADLPVVGDWDANGTDTPALFRPSVTYVRPAAIPEAPRPNGGSASRLARLTVRYASTRTRARRLGFGSTAPVSGRLVDEHGIGIGGAIVAVQARRRQTGAATAQIDGITTAADGAFSYRVPSGPSRTLTFAYTAFSADPQPATSASLRTLVRASLTAKMTPRSPRVGRVATFSGRLRYLPRAGVQIVIQARRRGVWGPAANVKTRAGGRFSWRYRFQPANRGSTIPFRAHVDSPLYPFTPSNSRPVNVRVR
jgi:hypothetical protein